LTKKVVILKIAPMKKFFLRKSDRKV